MHLSITDTVTTQEKEELLTGLRAYNGQFLDLSNFSGDIGVYMRDENGVMLALGNSFSQSDQFQQFLRFNVAQCMHPDIFAILEKAMNNAHS